jgi:hypothetical protein
MVDESRAEYYAFPKGGIELSACMYCKHKHEGAATCDAFPDGIPADILTMKSDHTEPFPGDNGIIFEPENPDSLPVRNEPLEF